MAAAPQQRTCRVATPQLAARRMLQAPRTLHTRLAPAAAVRPPVQRTPQLARMMAAPAAARSAMLC